MDGVGQHERARPRCHFGANHRLAEAQLAEHGCHIDATGKTDDTENWLGKVRSTDDARNSPLKLFLILLTTAVNCYAAHFNYSDKSCPSTLLFLLQQPPSA